MRSVLKFALVSLVAALFLYMAIFPFTYPMNRLLVNYESRTMINDVYLPMHYMATKVKPLYGVYIVFHDRLTYGDADYDAYKMAVSRRLRGR